MPSSCLVFVLLAGSQTVVAIVIKRMEGFLEVALSQRLWGSHHGDSSHSTVSCSDPRGVSAAPQRHRFASLCLRLLWVKAPACQRLPLCTAIPYVTHGGCWPLTSVAHPKRTLDLRPPTFKQEDVNGIGTGRPRSYPKGCSRLTQFCCHSDP